LEAVQVVGQAGAWQVGFEPGADADVLQEPLLFMDQLPWAVTVCPQGVLGQLL